jgi:endoribonuclease LACTB2
VLIDNGDGKPSWISALQRLLKQENATITEAITTHWHPDHTGGQADLLKVSPQTKVYKNTPNEGQLNIEDGQRFQVEGASLRAVFSPGHTQDHMTFVLEEENAMFTGDNVLGHGTSVFESLATYLDSLEKMQHVFGGRAYPGHGPVVEDGPGKVLEYIQHRKQREDQVLRVLRSSKSSPEWEPGEAREGKADEWTSMEMVKIIYKDVPENLHGPANGSVMQILYKLEGEDKVAENAARGTWRVKSRAAL